MTASGGENLRKELRSMWQFASICQFCGMFRSVFSLPAFVPADLEDAFVNGGPSTLLQQLHLKLLGPISDLSASQLKLESNNWEKLLRKILDTTLSAEVWENGEHPLSRVELYEEMSLSEKVLVLYHICQWSLDSSEEACSFASNPDDSRQAAIGEDAEGCLYYRFSNGSWLFRESPASLTSGKKRKHADPVWEVACSDLEGLSDLAKSMRRSRNAKQKKLSLYLEKDMLPFVKSAHEARQKAAARRERKELQRFVPRRQSTRVAKIVSSMEIEQAARRSQEEIERARAQELQKVADEKKRIDVEQGRRIRAERREEALRKEREKEALRLESRAVRLAKRQRLLESEQNIERESGTQPGTFPSGPSMQVDDVTENELRVNVNASENFASPLPATPVTPIRSESSPVHPNVRVDDSISISSTQPLQISSSRNRSASTVPAFRSDETSVAAASEAAPPPPLQQPEQPAFQCTAEEQSRDESSPVPVEVIRPPSLAPLPSADSSQASLQTQDSLPSKTSKTSASCPPAVSNDHYALTSVLSSSSRFSPLRPQQQAPNREATTE